MEAAKLVRRGEGEAHRCGNLILCKDTLSGGAGAGGGGGLMLVKPVDCNSMLVCGGRTKLELDQRAFAVGLEADPQVAFCWAACSPQRKVPLVFAALVKDMVEPKERSDTATRRRVLS